MPVEVVQPDMELALTVKYKNGTTQDVVAEFIDFIGFESSWKRSVRVLENEIRLTDWAWLAWSVETREKRTVLPFTAWCGTVSWVGETAGAKNPLLNRLTTPEMISDDLSDSAGENPLDMTQPSG